MPDEPWLQVVHLPSWFASPKMVEPVASGVNEQLRVKVYRFLMSRMATADKRVGPLAGR